MGMRTAYPQALRPAARGEVGAAEGRSKMAHRVMFHGLRVAVVGVLAGALLVGSPVMSVATARSAEVRTSSRAAAVGNTYGGVTSQSMPVVVDMTANRREIVRAVAALDLTCTSGGVTTVAPFLIGLSVTKKGRFSRTFGPVIRRN